MKNNQSKTEGLAAVASSDLLAARQYRDALFALMGRIEVASHKGSWNEVDWAMRSAESNIKDIPDPDANAAAHRQPPV